MAAAATERLFSLELLVDWVRLEAGPPPRAPGPAVAFRLLDFPPLLVRPPAAPGPGPPAPRGALGFGRGKACLLRLRPAALRRPLRAALLQLPAGPAAPRLLGACDIPLATAGEDAGPGARGRRGTFALRSPAGERVGDVALFYRLRDLGGRPPAWGPSDAPAAPTDGEEAAPRSEATSPEVAGAAERAGTASPPSPPASASVSPVHQDVAEWDLETNTFRPPPLYYTHFPREKAPPAPGDITIGPQREALEQLDGVFPETKLVNPPPHPSPPKHANSVTQEGPPVRANPQRGQDAGAVDQAARHPQTGQHAIDTIRQLPLLNALLIELSLLYNQPVASPTHVHPHLAWLYRTEDEPPGSSAKSSSQSEPQKQQLSAGERGKSVRLQCHKNQAESLKTGKYFEKSCGAPPKRVTRGKLLYGLTNTLRLRLKQTNPDMLVVHEKREQYRKTQAQTLGTKARKVLSFAEQSQKAHQPSKDKYLDLDASFAENGDTSRQISGAFDDSGSTKETKLKQATEKEMVGCGQNRISYSSLEAIVSPENSTFPERFTPTNILGGKLEVKVQSPSVLGRDTVVDRIVDKETDDRQVKTTKSDIVIADRSENRPSKNSCRESVSELKYSDDFTSPSYSEDFCTTEDTSRSLQARDGSSGAVNLERSPSISQSSETRLSIRKNSSEKTSVLSPPFSAGSPVHSHRKSHISKTWDKSLEEASSISASDLSSHWAEEKENQTDQTSMYDSEVARRDQDTLIKIKMGTGCKSLESQSPRTSQVSSYLPSNLSEPELKVLDSCPSDHFEDDGDDIGPLSISKQCKDICELVINKLPGYTV